MGLAADAAAEAVRIPAGASKPDKYLLAGLDKET